MLAKKKLRLYSVLPITAIGVPTINHKENQMRTTVKYAAYRNGVKICQSTRTFDKMVLESYAKREIARAHGVSPDDIEIISMITN